MLLDLASDKSDVMCGQFQIIATGIIVWKEIAVSASENTLKFAEPNERKEPCPIERFALLPSGPCVTPGDFVVLRGFVAIRVKLV